jgi:hypothetical protein
MPPASIAGTKQSRLFINDTILLSSFNSMTDIIITVKLSVLIGFLLAHTFVSASLTKKE